MLQIRLSAKGIFSFAKKPKAVRDRQFIAVVKHFQKEALEDYAMGRMTPNLKGRSSSNAFSVYGFKARTLKYQKQQRRIMGVLRPYWSPRRVDVTRLAVAAVRVATRRGNAYQLLNAIRHTANQNRPHMMEVISKPGGFRIKQVGKYNLRTSLLLPGARILNANRNAARGAVYRSQLLNLNLGGGRDKRAIIKNFKSKIHEWLPYFFASQPRIRLNTGVRT